MVKVDIPNHVWKLWKKSWAEYGVYTDEKLTKMLLTEIWEQSWESLTEDGSFIPYGYLTKELIESMDVDKLMKRFKGKSVDSYVRELEKELDIDYGRLLSTA